VITEATVLAVRSTPTPDVYRQPVTRTLETLEATVASGDSGGPVVDLEGTVIGVTNAGSPPSIGYSLSVSEIESDLHPPDTTPVGTGTCPMPGT